MSSGHIYENKKKGDTMEYDIFPNDYTKKCRVYGYSMGNAIRTYIRKRTKPTYVQIPIPLPLESIEEQ